MNNGKDLKVLGGKTMLIFNFCRDICDQVHGFLEILAVGHISPCPNIVEASKIPNCRLFASLFTLWWLGVVDF